MRPRIPQSLLGAATFLIACGGAVEDVVDDDAGSVDASSADAAITMDASDSAPTLRPCKVTITGDVTASFHCQIFDTPLTLHFEAGLRDSYLIYGKSADGSLQFYMNCWAPTPFAPGTYGAETPAFIGCDAQLYRDLDSGPPWSVTGAWGGLGSEVVSISVTFIGVSPPTGKGDTTLLGIQALGAKNNVTVHVTF